MGLGRIVSKGGSAGVLDTANWDGIGDRGWTKSFSFRSLFRRISVVDDWTSFKGDSATFISGARESRSGNTVGSITCNFDMSLEVILVWSSSVTCVGMVVCGGSICVGTSCRLV